MRTLARPLVRFVGALVLAASPATAQVTVTMTRSGSAIQLSWSGGTGPYDVIRTSSPRMSANVSVLASGIPGTTYTDNFGGDDGVDFYSYVVTDVAAKPALNITTPCDSPPHPASPCIANTTQFTIAVTGTTSVASVFVNEVNVTASAGTFSAPDVLLNLDGNYVTAAAKSATEDWAVDQVVVFRDNGNQAPNLSISVADRGDAAVSADGATIHDPTPEIVVDYDDANDSPAGVIDPADVKIYVNGTDMTTSFTRTATQATYQVPAGQAWSQGSNFVYAAVQDGNTAPTGSSMTASAHVVLSPPALASFTPAAEGSIGDAIVLHGAGFDPAPANNTVTFDGVSATVTAATRTTLDVTVPPGAHTGPVVVSVDGRSGPGKVFRVLLASGRANIGGVVVNPSFSNHVFFTDTGGLFEILDDGSVENRCAAVRPLGIAVDSAGDVYYGRDFSNPSPLYRYEPGSQTCGIYVADTKVPGQSEASIASIAITNAGGGGMNVYLDDYDNVRIKRVDPGGAVSIIANDGTAFRSGMAVPSDGAIVYFTEFGNLYSIPAPAGGASTLVKNDPAGTMHGLAITKPDDKLVIARTDANAVSWLDPGNASNPFWDLATGLTSPRGVALGEDAPGQNFVVVAERTRIYRLPRPTLTVTDAGDLPIPGKWVVDFASDTTDCVAANTITLKAKVNPLGAVPTTSPRQSVTWSVEDPDDPSPDFQVDPVDPTGPTPDNFESLSAAQWEEAPGYPIVSGSATSTSVQTEVVGGVSQVRVHLSCYPGDNYRFTAKATLPVLGTIEGSSDVLTVWRKLHVEVDSMGVAVGPFQDDDAVVDDIPDPVLDLLDAAFRPAYIEVVPPDTGADNSDVPFQYNVPSGGALAQEDLGQTAGSTAGRWVVYIQGAYEGDLSQDNDPDTESAVLGITDGFFRGSLTYFETIRDTAKASGWDDEYVRRKNVLHEIGHQFGMVQHNGCVMTPGPVIDPVFCPLQLFLIRNAMPPSGP